MEGPTYAVGRMRSRRNLLVDPRLGRTAVAAAIICFAEGLFFVFVRAPHPYGWEGFDHYRDYGLALARGEAYSTIERIWGYPYFLSIFYRVFGDRLWIPLVVQVGLNALVPLLLYVEVKHRLGARVAAVTALLAGALSFNTIYASTQSSDSICTVLFVTALVLFSRAQRVPTTGRFAMSGLFAALAFECRPNLLLLPLWLVAVDLITTGRRRALRHVAAFLLMVAAVWLPWPIRNYRLTGRFIPATTHGGVQLWYGSLEIGRYFENWVENPRAAFEANPFDYSLPGSGPLVITAAASPNARRRPQKVTMTYWTDRHSAPTSVTAPEPAADTMTFEVPAQPADTVVSYYFDVDWPEEAASGPRRIRTPISGPDDPFRHVVTANHFGDLDFHQQYLDVFDVVRLARYLAWNEPAPDEPALDMNADSRLTEADLDRAVSTLASPAWPGRPVSHALKTLRTTPEAATLVLADNSTLTVPRSFGGRMTDLEVQGTMAADAIRSKRSFAGLAWPGDTNPVLKDFDPFLQLGSRVNAVFYRAEPHLHDRYTALALDNIRRAPGAFALASLQRVFRLFVVVGSEDFNRAHQFRCARVIYGLATAASLVYLALFLGGAGVAVYRRLDTTLLLAGIVYVPLTIFPFLTNMRYTVTAQPVIFVFVAIAVVALADALRRDRTPAIRKE